jgi:endonuclease/exonuclease/phosphatase family metal-dependent hydrolase
MTWNIHGALGRNPRFDLHRVVELIRRWNPDIVALQEVDSRRAFAGGENPFEFLQHAVGSYGIGAKSITTQDGDYGQMLITRWPIARQEIHDISFPEYEPRRAIRADVMTPGGPLNVVATHLGLSVRERRQQARILLELAGEAEVPTVMVGDFNDWFWPGSVRSVLKRVLPDDTNCRTFPSVFPLLRLDRIFCRPRGALLRRFVDPEALAISDHLPVIADIAAPNTDVAATGVLSGNRAAGSRQEPALS